MKKFTLCLWVMLPALLSTQTAAAGTANVNFDPKPALAQSSLSKITVQFMDARYGIAPVTDVSGITLTRKGSTEVLYALPNPAVDYAKLTLEFAYKGDTEPVTITTEGIYTLSIPDGVVNTLDTMSPLGEVTADFTVSASATTEMSRCDIVPTSGTVDEITEIKLSFPDSGGLDWFYNDLFGTGNFSGITLSLKNNPEVKYIARKKSYDNNYTVVLIFVDGDGNEVTVTAPGTYVLDIPAGMFQKDYSSIQNDHITAEYIIKGAVAPEFEGMTATPADGESVGRFSQLTLVFPNMPGGLVYPISDINRATVTTPSGETFYGFSPSVGSEGGGTYNKLMLRFAPEDAVSIDAAKEFTEAGNYIVTIPEGLLKAYGKEAVNPEIKLTLTVDPMLDFTYNVEPAQNISHKTFGNIVFSCGNSLSTIEPNPDCTEKATISFGATSYELTARAASETSVTFSVPSDAVAAVGTWTVKIPANFFKGKNKNGLTITNTSEITTFYIIKEPQHFDFKLTPVDNSTIEFFKNITVDFSGASLKSVKIDTDAGHPSMTCTDGKTYVLTGKQSGKYVIFTAKEGSALPDGTYDVIIPAGYIITVDKENLEDAKGEIKTSFSIEKKMVDNYTDGILFLNEGWFGHDPGSLNFYGNDGEWTYDVFARNNADRRLGVTSQYGQCFGDKIYVVSKQSEGDGDGDGGVFTVMDAATMKFIGKISQLPDNQAQPRAFCAWNEHKGYLSSKSHIYTIDLDKMEVMSVVPGTDVYTKFDSNGEMLRYGNHVFAIRESSGVDAIDPATDDVTKISAELAEAFAVMPDGSLYVATRDESNEFVKISPIDLTIEEKIDIDSDRAKIANVWTTWRKAPLAASIKDNVVYYVTQKASDESMAGARTVASYNFDTKEFNETFIKLPGKADGEVADWVLYGEGISVDPATGNILLMAVEAGYGAHYSKNRVFVADPATGEILPGSTLQLDDAYWFPAMALYPDFEAPVISVDGFEPTVESSKFRIDVPAMTTLAVGNRHLVNYSVKSLDETLCTVSATEEFGVFEVTLLNGKEEYKLELSADYQGKLCIANLNSDKVGCMMTADDFNGSVDVYNLQGVCVRHAATADDLRNLPAGLYIVNGRKFIVR